jgi:hypothetical protein
MSSVLKKRRWQLSGGSRAGRFSRCDRGHATQRGDAYHRRVMFHSQGKAPTMISQFRQPIFSEPDAPLTNQTKLLAGKQHAGNFCQRSGIEPAFLEIIRSRNVKWITTRSFADRSTREQSPIEQLQHYRVADEF